MNTSASKPWQTRPANMPSFAKLPLAVMFIVTALAVLPVFIWFFCRIEPGAGEIAVLIRKTGADLPPGQIIALSPEQKGIQLEVLAEGRYFKNPYTWGWELHRITDIPAGQLGVVTRLYGDELPSGEILAGESAKGIMPEVLRPGKYRLNPYAYMVEIYDAISIRPGHVGVMISLIGHDVLHHELEPDQRNSMLVAEGVKGVQNRVLDPGTYYLNPYMVDVVEVNLQSQRYGMSGDDSISFLTLDGFTVTVEGTIEYALQRDLASLLTHRVGDMEDIIKKVILPRARGFSRIEGSKHPAINFIVGETRQGFQNDLENHLRERCRPWGVDIRSVLVRKITVPDEIASIIREREVAVQNALKFEQQIDQAKSQAELVRQEMLAVQNKEKVQADTARIRAVINARQDQAVRVIAAEKEREVARVEEQAAALQAEAIIKTAEGDRDAIRAGNTAEASVLADQTKAFKGGMSLARYRFYQTIGPRIRSVLSSDQEGGIGSIFESFLPVKEGGAR
ncbi:MAG TPA: SPFH domain-containing protein [Kiritimatiellia bacterium]|nr:SPFH domain-containing protein [Kiritimatiellia bacterium]HMO99034.1 SPFH domain-containing protein [Kiritimatiellia bacterium]HMP96110.1 SPFH domain-containing protein [Kiritimatiellia bacterium]